MYYTAAQTFNDPSDIIPLLTYSQNGSCVPNFETLIGNFEVENESLK